MIARIGLVVSFVIALLAIAFGVLRVAALEALEVNAGHATTLREAADGGHAQLVAATLRPDTTAEFELCASDPMLPERWADRFELQVRLDGEIGVRVPLTAEALEGIRRNDTSACMRVGRGPVYAAGEYTIVAVYDELPEGLADVPLRARIVAKPELGDPELLVVVLVWLASMLIVIFLAVRAKQGDAATAGDDKSEEERLWEEAQAELEPKKQPRKPLPGAVVAVIGLVLMLLGFFGIGLFTTGAAGGLAAGVALGLYEGALGVLLIGGATMALRLETAALVRPEKRWWLWFPGAVLGGGLLVVLAQLATSVVPSTSRSSVEAFVSWPSGLLSFAALAVAAPLAEEVFFRGFIYGALKKHHTAIAFVAAWLTFVAFHGSQTWGQWGALVGIGVTGLGLTSIRAISGSTLVAATAHLVYNGLLSVQAFL